MINFTCLAQARPDVINHYVQWGWPNDPAVVYPHWFTNLRGPSDPAWAYTSLESYAAALGCLTTTTPPPSPPTPPPPGGGGFSVGDMVQRFFTTDPVGATLALGVAAYVGYKFLNRD